MATIVSSSISCVGAIAYWTFARIAKRRRLLVRTEVAAAIIRRGREILITRRPANTHLAGLWEFPGGKVEPGESLYTALQREILEEIGVKIRIESEFLTVDYDYSTVSVRLHFFNCTLAKGDPVAIGVADLQWITLDEITKYPFPPADAELIAKLISDFTSTS